MIAKLSESWGPLRLQFPIEDIVLDGRSCDGMTFLSRFRAAISEE